MPTSKGKGEGKEDGKGREGEGNGWGREGRRRREGRGVPPLLSLHFKHWIYLGMCEKIQVYRHRHCFVYELLSCDVSDLLTLMCLTGLFAY